jgi:Fe-S-cluster containining protein
MERLARIKEPLHASSRAASEAVRSCAGCDARCCKAGLNSMRVSRIEALALARRLGEPDLAPEIPAILERARAEVEKRGLSEESDTTYDCPLLDDENRCMVHGPAQPAGCMTFKPVDDGGCDHDLPLFHRHYKLVEAAERKALGKRYPALPIPLALLKVLRAGDRSPRS